MKFCVLFSLCFAKFLLRMWLRVAPQAIHDQCSQYHGEVGSANANLATEKECRQPPGSTVAHSQTGALLKKQTTKEGEIFKTEGKRYLAKVSVMQIGCKMVLMALFGHTVHLSNV